MQLRLIRPGLFICIIFIVACKSGGKSDNSVIYKGVYSFGPEVKSFKDCDSGHEFWVTDNSAELELQYSKLNFEKPYEPVYVEVEGVKQLSGKEGMGSEFDSTLVVKKLVKITKEIPLDMCK